MKKNYILLVLLLCSACSWLGAGKSDDEKSLSEVDLNAQREDRFGSGSVPRAEDEGIFKDIHFDFDSSRIAESERAALEYNAEVLKQNSDIQVQLEGHCDERGTAEYNLALGQSRSNAVSRALETLGVDHSRLSTISYGEETPLDPGHSEDAWSKNRRVHFSAFRSNSK